MALNWYLQIRNLAKSEPAAAEILTLLQNAGTEDEKNTAKQKAQEYIASKESSDNTAKEDSKPSEEIVVEEIEESYAGDIDSDIVVDSFPSSDDTREDVVVENKETVEKDEEKVKQDLSQLAFNPRLAKCGITREEELFLNHVYVRKLSHEDKILMRRSIFQKKNQRYAALQAEYKAKRIAQKQKDLNDPEKIKFHQERKIFSAVLDALTNRRNIGWIFSNIEDLTPDIMKEFLKKPQNRNAINQINPVFIENFTKRFGE